MAKKLDNYETVKERKTRLKNDFPDSLILPMFLSDPTQSFNYALIGALIWKDKKVRDELSVEAIESISNIAQKATQQNAGTIMSSIAILAKSDAAGYSLSIAGGNGADRNAWVENAEESAVGRALDNLGYHSNSASKEEMEKVQYVEEARKQRQQHDNHVNNLIIQLNQLGYTGEYLQNVCAQSVRPFSNFHELSLEELMAVENTLQAILNQSNTQNQNIPQPV
ncbi:MAG: hypothetical protein IJ880_04755 [Bacilli bacterium]|nr:hypothetical protein [Bacilli bacterium]MBR3119732.1 hypothetical protein [Oceanobacillus sp.]